MPFYECHICCRDTSEKFQQMVSARLRLIQQMGHLAASLNITVAGNEGNQMGHLAASLNITVAGNEGN